MDEESIQVRMQQVLDDLSRDVASMRTGRANPSLISDLQVAVYGGTQRLKIVELANISAPDPYTLVVDPWDKSIIGEIRKGILTANIGLNPVVDKEILRVTLPQLTTEDRERMVRLLSQKLEIARVMVRQVRAEGMRAIKRQFEAKESTEDEKFRQEKRLQEITDEFIDKINEIGEKKKTELMEV